MLKRLGSILGFRPSHVSSPRIARFFSASRVNGVDLKGAGTTQKPRADALLRYHTDPAIRARMRAQAKAWQVENRDRYLQLLRAKNEVYKQDPAYVQKRKTMNLKDYHENYSKDPLRSHRRLLSNWVRYHFDIMSTLPWKTHRPIYQDTKVEHVCQGCGYAKHGGLKLWFLDLASDDQYYCPACYVKDIDASMPAGYEGITRWKDMVARKNKLDGVRQSNESKP
jgi:hypothetical protein